MSYQWLCLLPPLLVIATACISHNLNISLIFGIISAGLIASQGNIAHSFVLILERLWQQITNIDTLYLYIFLIAVPSLVVLLNKGGGPEAFANLITKRIRSAKAAQTASIISSFALCIDDYLSILTNGHIMRTLTDQCGVARVKLAFLIHALSGPLVILCPISSWVAAITAYLNQSGINNEHTSTALIIADPFYIYLHSLPFIFYSLFTIISVIFIVRMGISFGPMYTYEHQNNTTTTLEENNTPTTGSLWDLFVPLGSLLITVIVGILYTGDYYLFGGSNSLLEAFKNNTHIFFILANAGIISLCISFIFALLRNTIKMHDIPSIVYTGFNLMKPALIMVFLASILSILLRNDVMTGQYLASLASGAFPLVLLPAAFFIISLATSVSTGSSWGTFGLMLPIAVPMLTTLFELTQPAQAENISLLYPILGAIFSGAICGDHISPFSETTVMAAASTQVETIDHIKTQFPYALPSLFGCLASFIVAGILYTQPFWINVSFSFFVGITICCALLYLLNKNR